MIKTGLYLQDICLKEEFLQKMRNPKWNDSLQENACFYEDGKIFSQGSCQLFAYALSERFGYEIVEIKQGASCHYFCRTYKEDLIEEFKEEGAEFGYSFAKYLIRTNPHYYDINF